MTLFIGRNRQQYFLILIHFKLIEKRKEARKILEFIIHRILVVEFRRSKYF